MDRRSANETPPASVPGAPLSFTLIIGALSIAAVVALIVVSPATAPPSRRDVALQFVLLGWAVAVFALSFVPAYRAAVWRKQGRRSIYSGWMALSLLPAFLAVRVAADATLPQSRRLLVAPLLIAVGFGFLALVRWRRLRRERPLPEGGTTPAP